METLTINKTGRTHNRKYNLNALKTGQAARVELKIKDQYIATGGNGATYLLQVYTDNVIKLISVTGKPKYYTGGQYIIA